MEAMWAENQPAYIVLDTNSGRIVPGGDLTEPGRQRQEPSPRCDRTA